MPPIADILLLIPLLVLIVISAFFSGSETALFSLTGPQRLRFRKSEALAATTVTTLLAETRSLLITLLLGNMFINVLYFALSTILLLRLRRQPEPIAASVFAILSVLPLLLLILFGELFPKLIAAQAATTWSRFVAVPLWMVHRAIAPLRIVLNAVVVTPLARLIAPSNKPPSLSAEELGTLLEQSHQRGVLERDEEHLLQQVLELSQLTVRHIMTPRVDFRAFDLDDDPRVLIKLVEDTRLSFIPVFKKDLDHITGTVSARTILLERPSTREQLESLIEPVSYVPQVQPLDKLLVHLRKHGSTLVIVVDEYGGTMGLVTLEDVVEEMVGEIAGPYVPAESPGIMAVELGVWRVSAGLSVRDWSQIFGRVELLLSGVSTVAGLVMAQLGRLPRVGDRTQVGNVEIEVEQMKGHRITWLTIRILSADSNSESESQENPQSAQNDQEAES